MLTCLFRPCEHLVCLLCQYSHFSSSYVSVRFAITMESDSGSTDKKLTASQKYYRKNPGRILERQKRRREELRKANLLEKKFLPMAAKLLGYTLSKNQTAADYIMDTSAATKAPSTAVPKKSKSSKSSSSSSSSSSSDEDKSGKEDAIAFALRSVGANVADVKDNSTSASAPSSARKRKGGVQFVQGHKRKAKKSKKTEQESSSESESDTASDSSSGSEESDNSGSASDSESASESEGDAEDDLL